MKRLLPRLGLPLLLMSLWSSSATLSLGSTESRPRLSSAHLQLPLSFEINKGQGNGRIRFFARAGNVLWYFTENEIGLVARGEGRSASSLDIRLLAANRKVLVEGLDPLPGKSNYFKGSDPSKWLSNVPTYAKVRYRDIYPGIDLILYGNQGQLEFDCVIKPGGDVNAVRLFFLGAGKISLNSQGCVVVDAPMGQLIQHTPAVYQDIDGIRKPLKSEYVLRKGREVGFRVSDYDHNKPLIVDPVLSYSTYLGGNGGSGIGDLALDNLGNIYVVGGTAFADFPVTPGAFQTNHGGVFVAKFSQTGSTLVYSTYLGADSDRGLSIAVDSAGNAYITGYTFSPNFPTVNPVQPTFGGGSDAFIAKLNTSGSALIYSTYLGGSRADMGRKIAVDFAGNAYITGETVSSDFPTVKPFQPNFGGSESFFGTPPTETGDAFVAKLNPSGTALVYSSYLGGSRGDISLAIAADTSGNAYVTGQTRSADFPVLAPLQRFTESTDAFVTKVNGTGSLVYSTYLGGFGFNQGSDIAVDVSGNVYVTGTTDSANFPIRNPLQATKSVATDVFVTEINAAGSAIVFSTFLGGNDNDFGSRIALDRDGNIYVAGDTKSTNFPLLNPIQSSNRGDTNAFVTKLRPTGILYSTYLGGSVEETVGRILADASGNAFVAGSTLSSDFPTTSAAFQRTFSGGGVGCRVLHVGCLWVGFIAKISDGKKLYFAQFGDGSQGNTSIFSQITLVNLDSAGPASAVIEINGDSGNPLSVGLNGIVVAGRREVIIPPDGLVTLKTDGQGLIQVGSVVVTADRNISGVILFGGSAGTAGVGDSRPLRKFVAPMEAASGINTGIAMMGLGQEQTIQLELRNQQGAILARSRLTLGARSHLARLLTEFQWDTPPDFSNFAGTLTAAGTADFAATVIRVSPGEFATLPVAEKN